MEGQRDLSDEREADLSLEGGLETSSADGNCPSDRPRGKLLLSLGRRDRASFLGGGGLRDCDGDWVAADWIPSFRFFGRGGLAATGRLDAA